MTARERFADELRAAMLDTDVSQSELARRLHTSRQTVNKYRLGYVNLCIDRIEQVADALDCDLSIRLTPRRPVRRNRKRKGAQ